MASPAPVKRAVASSKKENIHSHCHVSGADALVDIAASVNGLSALLKDDEQMTADSLARRNRAWDTVLMEEAQDLSDDEFTATVKVFSDTCLADEYLHFPENCKKARHTWLNNAIAQVQNIL